MRAVLTAAFLLVAATSTALAQDFTDNLPPSGVIQGQIIEPRYSPEFEALSRRMLEAFAQNPAWFLQQAANRSEPPGVPLPYHENLGLTEQEYQRYIELTDTDGIIMVPVSPVEITVNRIADGTITFSTTSMAALPLTLVTISADGQYADLPFGRMGPAEIVNQDDATVPVGRWIGTSWDLEYVSSTDILTANLLIARRIDFDDVLLSFTVRSAGANPVQFDIDIFYPI